jgi:hypothetical protein
MDWRAWHEDYESSGSALSRRLTVVQAQIRAALDRAPLGPVQAISICAGHGQDLIAALADHPRQADVSARLVELDEHSVQTALCAATTAGLNGVRVVAGDASVTDAYAGAAPADLILLCGVLGNITADDIANTIRHIPSLCAAQATVIWTRHRHPPDLIPYIRETFEQGGFRRGRVRGLPAVRCGRQPSRRLAPTVRDRRPAVRVRRLRRPRARVSQAVIDRHRPSPLLRLFFKTPARRTVISRRYATRARRRSCVPSMSGRSSLACMRAGQACHEAFSQWLGWGRSTVVLSRWRAVARWCPRCCRRPRSARARRRCSGDRRAAIGSRG